MRTKIILCLSALSMLMLSCQSEPKTSSFNEMPAVPVVVTLPTLKNVTIYAESVGVLKASVSMEIKPEVSGTLTKVLVKEGEFVKKGTPLFIINPVIYESKVEEVKAQLSMDKAQYLVAEKKMERFRQLAERDFIAGIEWDDLETELARAKAMVELDEARLKAVSLDLEHCTLCSPISGRVGKLDVHPGMLVSSATPDVLVTIVKVNPLTIEFHVTEKEYAKLLTLNSINGSNLQEVELYSPCTKGFCKTGKMTFFDNHFDGKTGTLLVRGKVPNEDKSLRPGQTIRVKTPVSIIENALLIPQKAIRYNQQGPYAYVVLEDNTVALRPLVLDGEVESDQIVKEGIEASERVIIDGHLRLSPGVKVDVRK